MYEHGKGMKYWRTINAARQIIQEPSNYDPDICSKAETVIIAAANKDSRTLKQYSDIRKVVGL